MPPFISSSSEEELSSSSYEPSSSSYEPSSSSEIEVSSSSLIYDPSSSSYVPLSSSSGQEALSSSSSVWILPSSSSSEPVEVSSSSLAPLSSSSASPSSSSSLPSSSSQSSSSSRPSSSSSLPSSSSSYTVWRDTVPGPFTSVLTGTGRTNLSNFSGTKRDSVNVTAAENDLPAMRAINSIKAISPNKANTRLPANVKLVINTDYPRSITTAGPYNLAAVKPTGGEVTLQNPGVTMIGNNTTGYLADHYPKIRIDTTPYSGQQYTPTETYEDIQDYYIRDHYPDLIDTVGTFDTRKSRTVNQPVKRDSTLGTKTQGTTRRRNQAELTLLHNTGKDTLNYPVQVTQGAIDPNVLRYINNQSPIDNVAVTGLTAAQRAQYWNIMNHGQLSNNTYQFPRAATIYDLMGVSATSPTPDQNLYEYFP